MPMSEVVSQPDSTIPPPSVSNLREAFKATSDIDPRETDWNQVESLRNMLLTLDVERIWKEFDFRDAELGVALSFDPAKPLLNRTYDLLFEILIDRRDRFHELAFSELRSEI